MTQIILPSFDLNDVVIVKELSDLPDPVASVITLEANTVYWINGTIETLDNKLVFSDFTKIFGLNQSTDVLVSTLTTGVYMEITDSDTAITGITIEAPDVPNIFALVDTTPNTHFFIMQRCFLDGFINLGTVSQYRFARVRSCILLNFAKGFTYSGDLNGILEFENNLIDNNSDFIVDVTNSKHEDIKLTSNDVLFGSGGFLTGNATTQSLISTGIGVIIANAFSKPDSVVGITKDLSLWWFQANNNLDNSESGIEIFITNVQTTVISTADTYTDVAGNTTLSVSERFSMPNDMTVQYDGENQIIRIVNFIGVPVTLGGGDRDYDFALFFKPAGGSFSILQPSEQLNITMRTSRSNPMTIQAVVVWNKGDQVRLRTSAVGHTANTDMLSGQTNSI